MVGILLADAGSSKTTWSFIYGDDLSPIHYQTEGINPAHDSIEEIKDKFSEVRDYFPVNSVKQIFFYGAGCATSLLKQKIHEALIEIFAIQDITVDSDLVGASIALFGNGNGVACIVGTGSNAGLYINNEIKQQTPSLGYILGDEGSGVALGKILLNSIFKRQLPKYIIEKFEDEYNLKVSEVVNKIYCQPKPAAYIASFAPFMKRNIDQPEIEYIVTREFENFFRRNVLSLPHIWEYRIGMVGSIAYLFKDLIEKAANRLSLTVDEILKEPLPSLEQYYTIK